MNVFIVLVNRNSNRHVSPYDVIFHPLIVNGYREEGRVMSNLDWENSSIVTINKDDIDNAIVELLTEQKMVKEEFTRTDILRIIDFMVDIGGYDGD